MPCIKKRFLLKCDYLKDYKVTINVKHFIFINLKLNNYESYKACPWNADWWNSVLFNGLANLWNGSPSVLDMARGHAGIGGIQTRGDENPLYFPGVSGMGYDLDLDSNKNLRYFNFIRSHQQHHSFHFSILKFRTISMCAV